jgi:hypothetical protein
VQLLLVVLGAVLATGGGVFTRWLRDRKEGRVAARLIWGELWGAYSAAYAATMNVWPPPEPLPGWPTEFPDHFWQNLGPAFTRYARVGVVEKVQAAYHEGYHDNAPWETTAQLWPLLRQLWPIAYYSPWRGLWDLGERPNPGDLVPGEVVNAGLRWTVRFSTVSDLLDGVRWTPGYVRGSTQANRLADAYRARLAITLGLRPPPP